MRARRVFALLIGLIWAYDQAETVTGGIGDGAVHHEAASAAAVHQKPAAGDHGHEDAGSAGHQHNNQHRHGTAADHCTHQHGAAALILGWIFQPPASKAMVALGGSFHLSTNEFHSFFHPPKA